MTKRTQGFLLVIGMVILTGVSCYVLGALTGTFAALGGFLLGWGLKALDGGL